MIITGCSSWRHIILHPLTDKDIRFETQSGQNWTCVSDFYMEKIMQVRAEK